MVSPIQLTPNMDMATLTSALNQTMNQLESENRTKIIRDENGVDRVILGRFPDGDYGIKVSIDGVDVLTAKDSELVLSSSFNMWKIFKEGVISLTDSHIRSGSVTLNSTNIGYSLNVWIDIPNITDITKQKWEGNLLTNVAWQASKEPVRGEGLFYDDGTNVAHYNYSYYFDVITGMMNVQFNIRRTAGSVSVTPQDLFWQPFYWQIANPTRDTTAGSGSTGSGSGKYLYVDTVVFNEDGTVKQALESITHEFFVDQWQPWPRSRLNIYHT